MAESAPTLADAARLVCTHFTRSGHTPYTEIAIAVNGGKCVTSGQLETAIRRLAAERTPPLECRGLRVELKRVDASKGTVHVVTGVG